MVNPNQACCEGWPFLKLLRGCGIGGGYWGNVSDTFETDHLSIYHSAKIGIYLSKSCHGKRLDCLALPPWDNSS